jgi:hypothetical protein
MKYKWINEIKGLEHIKGYKIYENGEVVSNLKFNGKQFFTSNISKRLKPMVTKKGYLKVELKGKVYFIHRLVGLAFIPNPENKLQINHKDTNKLNNNMYNLEWSTNKENHKHKMENGLNITLSGKEHYRIKKVGIYDLSGNFIKSFFSITEAMKQLGLLNKHGNICACLKGRQKTAYGYIWKYL